MGGAAKLFENALARALPVVIGFLASLLGIGGLAKKVEKIITRIRSRIDRAVDSLLMRMRGLFKGNKGKGNKNKDTNNYPDPEHDTKVAKGLQQIDEEEKKYLNPDG